jgi:glycosyltransferase involved in cell wall biosynthesis
MKIGIVTTWFERGAAIVSRQFMDVLNSQGHDIYIYARGGEHFAKNDKNWNLKNVTWNKYLFSNIPTDIDKTQFLEWIKNTNLDCILFNEQQFLAPVAWAKDLQVPCIAYIDYYTKDNINSFNIYDQLWCNTKRHFSAFSWHEGARYIPWGTDISIFNYKGIEARYQFFHSSGMSPYRKGTDIFINAMYEIKDILKEKKLKSLIHTQVPIKNVFPNLKSKIEELEGIEILDIIHKTIPQPGLYNLGKIYIYPSRLEGIGLTLAEAACSGLYIVTSRNEPMTEFAMSNFSDLIDIDNYFSRKDNYYWDMCEPSIRSLKEIMLKKIKIDSYQISQEAAKRFHFKANATSLSEHLNEISFRTIDCSDKTLIFENDSSIGILFKSRNKLARIIFGALKKIKDTFYG